MTQARTLLRLRYWLSHPRTRTVLTRVAIGTVLVAVLLAGTPLVTPGLDASPVVTADSTTDPVTAELGVNTDVHVTIEETTTAYTAGDGVSNQVVYPYAGASDPTLTVTPTAGIPSPDTESSTDTVVIETVTVDSLQPRVEYTATVESGAASNAADGAIWSDTQTLTDTSRDPAETVTVYDRSRNVDATAARVSGTVDIGAVADRVGRLDAEFGRNVDVTVQYAVTGEYTIQYRDGEDGAMQTETVTITETAPISVAGITGTPDEYRDNTDPSVGPVPTYQFAGTDAANDVTLGSSGTSASVTAGANSVPVDAWLLGIAFLAFTAAVASRVTSRVAPVTEGELQRAANRDWITPIDTLPAATPTTPEASDEIHTIATLPDLIDLAVDKQERVYDPSDAAGLYVCASDAVFRCDDPLTSHGCKDSGKPKPVPKGSREDTGLRSEFKRNGTGFSPATEATVTVIRDRVEATVPWLSVESSNGHDTDNSESSTSAGVGEVTESDSVIDTEDAGTGTDTDVDVTDSSDTSLED